MRQRWPRLPIFWCAVWCLAAAVSVQARGEELLVTFEKRRLSEQFFSEGASFGDLNGDGVADVVAGPYWYQGPDFQQRQQIYVQQPFDTSVYSNNFFAFVHDFNGDQANDVLFIGFPGLDASWFENPKERGGSWERHQVFDAVDNESPAFQDLTGDGRPELICQTGGKLGFASPDWEDPAQPWVFHPVSQEGIGGRFTHGLGVGDIDGDGRLDLLLNSGWYRQPESLEGDPPWEHHPATFGGRGGAQIHGYDVDGDGDTDVISSWNAHGFGLYWFEQVREQGEIAFLAHQIMGDAPEQNEQGVVIGNLHAVDVVDMDGDGLKDIVTGSRFWAHNGNDAADHQPALLYWFRLVREDDRKARFEAYEIDDDSGVGTQVVAGDVDGDGQPDVVVGNKQGAFLHLQRREQVSRARYEEARRFFRTRVMERWETARVKREGEPARAKDGRALNLDFESGDLTDWTADGEAFIGTPCDGDTVRARRSDMQSQHAGRYWVGSFEPENSDQSQGTLTSASFEVTKPFASFLVGGGKLPGTRVELVRSRDGQVLFTARGRYHEAMEPAFADLSKALGEQIFIRLVDLESGGWGHINFDDFMFHPDEPEVRKRATLDLTPVPGSGRPPLLAAREMTVPEGFQVELIAGEPDLHQPIAFCFDDRGRIFVVEAHSYPKRREEGQGLDKILVFEDTDGDGQFDRRTQFMEGLNLVSGIEVGFGGVWVGAAPYLMFIPDRDADLIPDGPPEILLDGFGFQDTHETLNAFIWGPDGWLYGCHGVFTHSRVGPPGTPDEQRQPLNAGIWRYHPLQRQFEVFAFGTSNPWGVDFDDHGQAVLTACVIPHLYQAIQGGRFERQAGSHFNPYVFDDIKTIADHVHYVGASPHGGNGVSGAVGGGHAHCGAMIYLGDGFPGEYRGKLFMNNIHGNRVNMDVLSRQGSGLAGSHGRDFLLANDPWYRGVNLRYGPAGSVYLIDWYDEQGCHLTNPEIWDRTNGRLYRVSHGEHRARPADVASRSDEELVQLLLHRNDWFVRHARRVLQERYGTAGHAPVHALLLELFEAQPDVTRKLRALWALHSTAGLTEERALSFLDHEQEYVRAWTVQLALEDRQASPRLLAKLEQLAAGDPSPVVRLYLASGLQRLEPADRFGIAGGLLSRAEDAEDHNLPLLIWYGVEPLCTFDPERALELLNLADASRLPLIARYIVRRMASGADRRLDVLVEALRRTDEEERLAWMLDEIHRALEKSDDLVPPPRWPQVAEQLMRRPALRERVTSVALCLGDPSVAPFLRERLGNAGETLERRRRALEDLVRFRDPELPEVLFGLLDQPELRREAIRALAGFDHPATGSMLLVRLPQFDAEERDEAVNALISRASYARPLLTVIAAGRLPAELLDAATTRRQLALLQDEQIDALLEQAWGRSVARSEETEAQIARYKRLLDAKRLAQADLSRGRSLFTAACATCHTLFGAGAAIGPDLTGSNRANLDYILGNIIDPNSEVGKQYMLATVELKNGRLLSGMLAEENEATLTVRNDREQQVIRRSEIALDRGNSRITRSTMSLMPAGLLQSYTDEDVRDLIAYLASPVQVPLPATAANLESFFNGRDLTGWSADPELWSVEQGELVGRAENGLEQNAFAWRQLLFGDFRLVVKVRLVDDRGNSGIQFRSSATPEGSLKGYQADVGPGWWGKLYEEHGRGLLWDESGERHVRAGEWNTYEILAVGSRIRTAINGQLCVDLEDPDGDRLGVIGLQIHSGGPTEVRFREFQLELDPAPELATVRR